jgi:hypothetical protein
MEVLFSGKSPSFEEQQKYIFRIKIRRIEKIKLQYGQL